MDEPIEERYAGLKREPLQYAACVSWTRGVAPEEVLRRLGAPGPIEAHTVMEVDQQVNALHASAPGNPVGGVADRVGDWTLLVEPNGWAATAAAGLHPLSAATETVSLFWNVNGLAEFAVARDGQTVALLHELVFFVKGDDAQAGASHADVQGSDPSLVRDLVDELAKVTGYDWLPVVLAWVERHTGALLPAGWLDAPHPSAAFAKPR